MYNDNGIGRFTYYSHNGSSTIDYLILNEDNIISKFEVLPKLVESDHCPMQFNISNTKLCAVIDGCNTDTLCDMFNGMIENVISPLFPARKHISKQRKNTQNNFPSNPWYDRECKSLKYVVNNIAKQRDFNARHGEYNIMLL